MIGAETHPKETRMRDVIISVSEPRKKVAAKKKSKKKTEKKEGFVDWLNVNIALVFGWDD